MPLFKHGPLEHGLMSVWHDNPLLYWLHSHMYFPIEENTQTPWLEQLAKHADKSAVYVANKSFNWVPALFTLNREEGDTIEYKDTLVNDDDGVDDDDVDVDDDDVDVVIDVDEVVIEVDEVVVDVNDDVDGVVVDADGVVVEVDDDVIDVDEVVIDVDLNDVAISFVVTAGFWQITL